MRRFRFALPALLFCALMVGTSPSARAQSATTLFFDDFSAGKLDTARWNWERDDVRLSRTQYGGTPTFGRDANGTTWMRVALQTYNPDFPGDVAKGTELFTREKWNLNAGVEYEARMRFPVGTPGWVGGFFSYSGVGTWPDTYQQAEGDFEFLFNRGDGIWTNLWDDWNPLRGGPRGDMSVPLPGFNWKDGAWHIFKMRWEPTQTTWFVDGRPIRTETRVQPGGAQGVRFNAWLADPNWGAASSASLGVAASPSANQNLFYDVDSLTVRALPNPPVGAYGTGTGLSGTYFNTKNLTDPRLTRVDSRLNFDWGAYAPDPAINVDGFSVRWDGQVQARFDETYTFSTASDDGVRLWVNGVQLVNLWQNGGANAGSGSIALKAGQKVPIRVEYFDNAGDASMHLRWSSPSTSSQLVPQSQLYPTLPASAATPTFSVPSGTYTSVQNVAISSATPGATIRYTLDGSTPTENSSLLASGQTIRVDKNLRIGARAFAPNMAPSGVASANYSIALPLSVAFSTPASNARISNFSSLAGTATSAANVDIEIKRVSDSKFWNGWVWQTGETAIPSQLLGTNWKVVVPASNGAGIPTGSNLQSGAYTLEADAYDAGGNIAIARRNISVGSASVAAASAPAS